MSVLRSMALVCSVALALAAGAACQLKRPDVIPTRMIEPQLIEPTAAAGQATAPGPGAAAGAVRVRLLETQSRAHIGRRLLHQRADGELAEDPMWLWTSGPARYLDSSLRMALSSARAVQFVDSSNATSLAVTLIEWQLDASGTQLVGAVEADVTGADRVVRTQVIRRSEPVSGGLPGNLASASGRLLQSLAGECVQRATQAAR